MLSPAFWRRRLPLIQQILRCARNPRSLTPSMMAATKKMNLERAWHLRFNCFTLFSRISWMMLKVVVLFLTTRFVILWIIWKQYRQSIPVKTWFGPINAIRLCVVSCWAQSIVNDSHQLLYSFLMAHSSLSLTKFDFPPTAPHFL